uniref:Uncharacterized protein n=1 Tax=Rhipicephalus microplus TaxID=6941 RepID=A0A6M2DDQ1_RHIMP
MFCFFFFFFWGTSFCCAAFSRVALLLFLRRFFHIPPIPPRRICLCTHYAIRLILFFPFLTGTFTIPLVLSEPPYEKIDD